MKIVNEPKDIDGIRVVQVDSEIEVSLLMLREVMQYTA